MQYGLAKTVLGIFGRMPRETALGAGHVVARVGYLLARRQRNVALQNLQMAMPELSELDRERIMRDVFSSLARLLVEFSQFPKLNPDNISDLVEYDGLENYLASKARGRGVLFLTAHIGAWELSSFAHGLYGYPMKFLTRPLDNPLIESMINRMRTLSGNQVIGKSGATREVLKALRNNETVGILVDQNTIRSEGVFADFFGIPAATTPALATFAMRTGAAVVPGYIHWEPERHRHILRFDPALELVQTGEQQQDILANTQLFNHVLERRIRQFPGEWLWIHKRWKTRPDGEPALY
jgi:KDO2-lipid IV(A) lauroyltransferase